MALATAGTLQRPQLNTPLPARMLPFGSNRISAQDRDYQRLHAQLVRALTRSVATLVRELRAAPQQEGAIVSAFIHRQTQLLRDAYAAAHAEGARDYWAEVSLKRAPRAALVADPAMREAALRFYTPSVAKMAFEAKTTAARVTLADKKPAGDGLGDWQQRVAPRIVLQARVVWSGLQDGYMAGRGEDPASPWRYLYWELGPVKTEHCDDCPRMAAASPYDAPGEGPNVLYTSPGDGQTQCGANCHCTLRYGPAPASAAAATTSPATLPDEAAAASQGDTVEGVYPVPRIAGEGGVDGGERYTWDEVRLLGAQSPRLSDAQRRALDEFRTAWNKWRVIGGGWPAMPDMFALRDAALAGDFLDEWTHILESMTDEQRRVFLQAAAAAEAWNAATAQANAQLVQDILDTLDEQTQGQGQGQQHRETADGAIWLYSPDQPRDHGRFAPMGGGAKRSSTQCLSCHRYYRGPREGENPGHIERDETTSHGYCPTCAAGEAHRDWVSQLHQRILRRRPEVTRAQVEEAIRNHQQLGDVAASDAGAILLGFDPNEPRGFHGRWVGEGGAGREEHGAAKPEAAAKHEDGAKGEHDVRGERSEKRPYSAMNAPGPSRGSKGYHEFEGPKLGPAARKQQEDALALERVQREKIEQSVGIMDRWLSSHPESDPRYHEALDRRLQLMQAHETLGERIPNRERVLGLPVSPARRLPQLPAPAPDVAAKAEAAAQRAEARAAMTKTTQREMTPEERAAKREYLRQKQAESRARRRAAAGLAPAQSVVPLDHLPAEEREARRAQRAEWARQKAASRADARTQQERAERHRRLARESAARKRERERAAGLRTSKPIADMSEEEWRASLRAYGRSGGAKKAANAAERRAEQSPEEQEAKRQAARENARRSGRAYAARKRERLRVSRAEPEQQMREVLWRAIELVESRRSA